MITDLNLNRLLIRTENKDVSSSDENNTTEKRSVDVFNSKNSNNTDSDQAKENNDARNIMTGTVIVSCFIKTSNLANRVELSGNDMRLYDDSKGSGGTITGDTSTISFIRADEEPGTFVIQKRHGKDNDLDNVMEMFYSDSPTARYNYFYLGRRGDDSSYYTNYIELTADHQATKSNNTANGQVGLNMTKDGVSYVNSRISLIHTDALSSPVGEGVRAFISGEGTYGGVQQTYFNGAGVLQSYIILDKDGIQYSQAGRVSAAGVAGTKFPPNWTVTHNGTGDYIITHNLGHSNYAVIATPIDNLSCTPCAVAIGNTTFKIVIVDITGNPADVAFSFAVL